MNIHLRFEFFPCCRNNSNLSDMPRSPKKIKFSMNDYKSETVFAKSSIKDKPKKKKKIISPDDDYEPSSNVSHKLKSRVLTPYKEKTPRKRKLVISYSTDSFQEDSMDTISPSKSELSQLPNLNKSNYMKGEPSVVDITSDSEDSNNSFSFSNFFDTRDHSLNESITEAHSGIDYEFISNGIGRVKICGKQILKEKSTNFLESENIVMREEEITDPRKVERRIENTKCQSTKDASAQVDQSEWKSNCTENFSTSNSQSNSEHVENTFVEVSLPSDSLTNNISINETSESIQELPEPPKSSKKNINNYHEMKEEQLVLLRENCSLTFFGMFRLKVLQGTIEVLGCIINKHSEEINLYSPRGSALLVLKNVSVAGKSNALYKNLGNSKEDEHLKELAQKETTAIFKYTKVDDSCLKCTEKYISQQIFPKLNDSQAPQVIFEPEGNWNVVSQSPLWDEVLSWVTGSTKLMVTGGKGVGKSTFIKYAINRLLNQYEKIRVIDLDPGQPEFTVPGCISVLTITEPIFGPNYTHLRKAGRSYLSNINVGHDPSKYLKTIELLMMELDPHPNIPTLINYMGFTQGIGLNLVSSTITYVLPTDVVQISSKAYEKNFKKLSMETVKDNCFSLSGDPSCINFKLHELTSMNDSNSGWILKPRQTREMCVLSYLGQMLPEGINSLKSCELPMYEIGLDSIKIVDIGRSEISPAAVNANLVALCSKAFHCMGYGIVRGIDFISQTLILMTPELPDILEDVFYLVMTVVQFPPSVFMTPDEVTGHIPYVMEGEFVSLEKITKRSYVPVNKK